MRISKESVRRFAAWSQRYSRRVVSNMKRIFMKSGSTLKTGIVKSFRWTRARYRARPRFRRTKTTPVSHPLGIRIQAVASENHSNQVKEEDEPKPRKPTKKFNKISVAIASSLLALLGLAGILIYLDSGSLPSSSVLWAVLAGLIVWVIGLALYRSKRNFLKEWRSRGNSDERGANPRSQPIAGFFGKLVKYVVIASVIVLLLLWLAPKVIEWFDAERSRGIVIAPTKPSLPDTITFTMAPDEACEHPYIPPDSFDIQWTRTNPEATYEVRTQRGRFSYEPGQRRSKEEVGIVRSLCFRELNDTTSLYVELFNQRS